MGGESRLGDECCSDIVTVKAEIKTLKDDATEFKAFMKEMRDAITYRLPLWATFAMSALSMAVGWLLSAR